MTITGIVFSTHPFFSLVHAGTGINKAFILPFVAMECVRNPRDLQRLVWACVLACFWEGLDGLWQAYSGHDFIMGYAPNNGRLTGSLGDYTVGNYLALVLIPAFGVWFILRTYQGFAATTLLCAALFWPAFFLFLGASSRSGILAIAGAMCLWCFLNYGWRIKKMLLWFLTPVLIFIIAQPARLMPAQVINDDRWDLWRIAWRVFLEHPFFGAGAGQYNATFRELGLAPVHEVITITHPHNLYLDMLYAHGIFGFLAGIIFLGGFLYWGGKHIARALRAQKTLYWQLAAWFWLGYAGWLINGLFGHDFYRTWWLAEAMCWLGIMAGAVVNGEKDLQKSP